jgi:hypothetical protein
MDYGFAFLSTLDIQKEVALAERSGFTHASLSDSHMVCADVSSMPCALRYQDPPDKALHQRRNPLSRIAPVTACNFGSPTNLSQDA